MRRVLAGAAALAVVVGCSPSATPAEQRAGESILLAASSDPGGAMDALIEGTLIRTDEGCLAVEQDRGHVVVLQFPFGTTLGDDGESVDVPGLGTLRLGDEISGGGGYVDVPTAPAECRLGPEFAVWQTVPDSG